MTTEITTKSNLPAQQAKVPEGLECVGSVHLNQRYLTLLHATSNALSTNENLKPGQIIDSETQEIVGGRDKAIDGFFCYFGGAFWLEGAKDKPKDRPAKYPLTLQNCAQKWEDGNIRRKTSYEFYFLPKGANSGMPYLLTFSGASSRSAKAALTYLTNTQTPLYGTYFSIGSQSKTGKAAGNPVWYLTAKPTTKTSAADFETAKSWKDRIQAIQDKLGAPILDESEDGSADEDKPTPF